MLTGRTASRQAAEAPLTIAGSCVGADSWLLCRSAAHLYGIPVEHVVEVMRVLPIEPVAGAPNYVRGLSVIRGVPMAVIDIGILVAGQTTLADRLVVIRAGERSIALLNEAVLGIRAVPAEVFRQMPPLLRDAADGTIVAVGTIDAELLFVLHAARLVPEGMLERPEVTRAIA